MRVVLGGVADVGQPEGVTVSRHVYSVISQVLFEFFRPVSVLQSLVDPGESFENVEYDVLLFLLNCLD